MASLALEFIRYDISLLDFWRLFDARLCRRLPGLASMLSSAQPVEFQQIDAQL